MGSVIRKVGPEDCEALAIILTHAYPGSEGITEESIQTYALNLRNQLEDDPDNHFYGAYRDGKLLGAFKLTEFTMNLRAAKVRAGGIAAVCVHFLHKKEKVARDMLLYAMEYYRSLGVHIAVLYPFHTGFYKNMGFGYGPLKHQFRIKPEAFPQGKSKRKVEYLTSKDAKDMLNCYQKYAINRTGTFERREIGFNGVYQQGHSVVGVRDNAEITGYLSFRFKSVKPEYSHKFDLVVEEFIYTTPDALSELFAFLHSQSDQIHQIILVSQDEDFHYLFADPTNKRLDSFETTALESSVTAIGAMYRVLDVKSLFDELHQAKFGDENCIVKITLIDRFIETDQASAIVRFHHGAALLVDEGEAYEVEMKLHIDNFSSLLIGAVRFNTIYEYGLATLSDSEFRDKIDRLFLANRKPGNDTEF